MTTGDNSSSQTTPTDTDDHDALQTLRFLEGSWHSDGQGPYGPYALEATAEIRGRWLLLTYTISEPTSHDVFYVSTQVYGYDDEGLVLELFDTAGSFTFHGVVLEDDGVRFDWKDGENWKRSEFHPHGENLDFRYDSMEPDASSELSTFEGTWHPGARTAKPG
jgi:hypothetical protein